MLVPLPYLHSRSKGRALFEEMELITVIEKGTDLPMLARAPDLE